MQHLYQKKHGLPGIPLSSGINGVDGTSGNNVYFGYVYDFFDYTEIEIDNILRIAQRSYSSGYYTGVYDKVSDNAYVVREELDYSPNPSTLTNIFKNITDAHILEEGELLDYKDYFKMSYDLTPDDSSTSYNRSYTKVDTAESGKDIYGAAAPWNVDDPIKEEKYFSPWEVVIEGKNTSIGTDFKDYPYHDVNDETYGIFVDSSARIKPGYNILPTNSGFDLFSIISNGESYTFSENNERYSGIYNSFEYGKDTSITHPSIEDIKNYVNPSNPSIGPVDYLKYAENATDTTIVPDRLSSNIKAGDVLYFYTDKSSFAINNQIQYMVVITEALERCKYEQLVEAAVIVNPFTFKYSDEKVINGDNYVYTTSKVVSGYYDSPLDDENVEPVDNPDYKYMKVYGKNLTKMLSYMSDSIMNLGNLQNKLIDGDNNMNNEMLHLVYKNYYGNIASEFKIESQHSKEDSSNIVIFDAGKDSAGNMGRLRMPNLIVRDWNVGNIETVNVVSPVYIRTDNTGYVYSLSKNDFNSNTNTFVLSDDKFLNDLSYSDYKCGFDVTIFDQTKYKDTKSYGYDAVIKKYVFTADDSKTISLDTNTFGTSTAYDIVFWITDANSISRYSRHTLAAYNSEYSRFDISILPISGYSSDEPDYDNSTSKIQYTQFKSSGISSDESKDAFIDIYVPENARNVKLYMNANELDFDYHTTVSNGWCTALPKLKDGTHYRIDLNINSNIPVIGNYTATTAKDFNKYSGPRTDLDGCEIFSTLLSGKTIKTDSRSVSFTADYDLGELHINEFTDVVQPGYIDKRRVPKVNLELRNDLNKIELANQLKNGVMCNQFQFFIDVNITDFSEDLWGSYVDSDKITLNLDIKNCDYDYELIQKYTVQQPKKTATLHINNVTSEDLNDNYFRIKAYLVGTEIRNPESVSQQMLDDSNKHVIETNIGTIEENVTWGTDDDSKNIHNDDAIYATEDNKEYFEDINDRSSGLNDQITIQLRNIKFSDIADQKKFRIRVLVEFGNPVFSKLFFRFYVSNMYVKYQYGSGESEFTKFDVGTDKLVEQKQIGNLFIDDYMFATKTFNVFVSPVSYLAIPSEDKFYNKADMSDIAISDTDSYQITTALKRYVPTIERVKSREERNERYIRQEMGWFDFFVNKKYFQDNVKELSVRPVNLKSIENVISSSEVFFKGDTTIDEVESRREETNYLALMYDSRFYNRRKHLDTYMFTYCETEFEAKRYSQVYDVTPIFTYQEATQEIRDNKLYNSIRSWNRLFAGNSDNTEGLFGGHIAPYGNGYMFIDGNYDYDANAIYSLTETKTMNDVEVSEDNRINDTKPFFSTLCQPDTELYAQPKHNNWFRRLLYQTEWWYPKYYIDENTNQEMVKPFKLVPGGEYYLNYADTKTHKEAEIPYNLLYSIYPRCAYDSDNDNLIVFMLRCPNISDETHNRVMLSDDFGLNAEYVRHWYNEAKVVR